MMISLRVTDDEYSVIKTYAESRGETVSEMIRRTVTERIEDEYDIRAYLKAKEDLDNDPVTYTHAYVKKELGPF